LWNKKRKRTRCCQTFITLLQKAGLVRGGKQQIFHSFLILLSFVGTGAAGVGALGDSAYEYLFKTWFLTNKENTHAPLLLLFQDVMKVGLTNAIFSPTDIFCSR
jgi:hypothetical protein